MKQTILSALAVALFAAVTFAQDPPKQDPPKPEPAPKAEPKKCDLAKTEMRDHCSKCQKFLNAADIVKGGCRTCSTKAEKVMGCVKLCYSCKMHAGKDHLKPCCGTKGCCIEKTVVAHVLYKCDKCGEQAATDKEIKHKEEKCDGKAQKTCDLSGKFPHGGEEEK